MAKTYNRVAAAAERAREKAETIKEIKMSEVNKKVVRVIIGVVVAWNIMILLAFAGGYCYRKKQESKPAETTQMGNFKPIEVEEIQVETIETETIEVETIETETILHEEIIQEEILYPVIIKEDII